MAERSASTTTSASPFSSSPSCQASRRNHSSWPCILPKATVRTGGCSSSGAGVTARIGLLMPHYSSRSHSYWPLVAQALAEAGAVVDVVHPPRGALDLATLRVDHDLYVLRKLSGLALSLAGALHELGAAIL